MTPTLDDWRERAERAEMETASLRETINRQLDRITAALARALAGEAKLTDFREAVRIQQQTLMAQREAAEVKLGEAVGWLTAIRDAAKDGASLAWIHAVAKDALDARPSPAPTIMCDECERPMMRDSSCEWHCEHCHPPPTEAPAPGTEEKERP